MAADVAAATVPIGYHDNYWVRYWPVPFVRLGADAVVAAVGVEQVVAAVGMLIGHPAGGEPEADRDDSGSGGHAVAAAVVALKGVGDGTAEADDSPVRHHLPGSWTEVVRRSCCGCSAAIPVDTGDDRIAAAVDDVSSYHHRTDFAVAVVVAEVADSAPGQSLASASSAHRVVVPCFAGVAAGTADACGAADGD